MSLLTVGTEIVFYFDLEENQVRIEASIVSFINSNNLVLDIYGAFFDYLLVFDLPLRAPPH